MIVLQDAAMPLVVVIPTEAHPPHERGPAAPDFAALLTDAANQDIEADWPENKGETAALGTAMETLAPVSLQCAILCGAVTAAAATFGEVPTFADATTEASYPLATRNAPDTLMSRGSLPQVDSALMNTGAPLARQVGPEIKPGVHPAPARPQAAGNQSAENGGSSLETNHLTPEELRTLSTEIPPVLLDLGTDERSDASQRANLNGLRTTKGEIGLTGINPPETPAIDAGTPELAQKKAKIEPFFIPDSSAVSDPGTAAQPASATAAQLILAPAQPHLSQGPGLSNTGSAVVATPPALPDMVAHLARDSESDQITILLEPPELGRVLIDFKFDGNMLQHISIMAETPEAVRQLRTLHAELIEALVREGIGEASMSFDERPPSSFTAAGEGPDLRMDRETYPLVLVSPPTSTKPLPRTHLSDDGRLDIRL